MAEKITEEEKLALKELKLKNPDLKNKSRYQQIKKVKEFLENQVNAKESTFRGDGLLSAEKDYAQERYDDYKSNYDIKSSSDLQLLETLVYWETLECRYKIAISNAFEQIKEIEADGFDGVSIGDAIDKDTMTAFKESSNMIVKFKEKLGLLYVKETESDYNMFESMQKKVLEWGKTNVSERTWTCRHCGKNNILYVNPEYWHKTASKHPHFKGKVLFNEEIMKLYLKAEILKPKLNHLNENLKKEIMDCLMSNESVAKVLEASADYVSWLVKKGWVEMEDYQKLKKSLENG